MSHSEMDADAMSISTPLILPVVLPLVLILGIMHTIQSVASATLDYSREKQLHNTDQDDMTTSNDDAGRASKENFLFSPAGVMVVVLTTIAHVLEKCGLFHSLDQSHDQHIQSSATTVSHEYLWLEQSPVSPLPLSSSTPEKKPSSLFLSEAPAQDTESHHSSLLEQDSARTEHIEPTPLQEKFHEHQFIECESEIQHLDTDGSTGAGEPSVDAQTFLNDALFGSDDEESDFEPESESDSDGYEYDSEYESDSDD